MHILETCALSSQNIRRRWEQSRVLDLRSSYKIVFKFSCERSLRNILNLETWTDFNRLNFMFRETFERNIQIEGVVLGWSHALSKAGALRCQDRHASALSEQSNPYPILPSRLYLSILVTTSEISFQILFRFCRPLKFCQ